MDDVTRYNRERWNALVAANAVFTRPAYLSDNTKAQRLEAATG